MSDKFIEIPMADIFIDEEFNCRGRITPIDVVDLAKNIAEHGLLQPVIISIQSEEQQAATGKKYRLIAGFRRYKAHVVNAAKVIVSSLHPGGVLTEKEARYLNLSENLLRKDLNILQEALAIKSLYDVGSTEAEAMRRLNKSRGWIQMRFALLDLPLDVQKEVAAGFITQPQIRQLHKIHNKGTRDELHVAVRLLKEAKVRGEKAIVLPPPKSEKAKIKHHMSKREIIEMQTHIRETIGNNIGTRALAWAAGNISNAEFIGDIQAEARRMGKDYHRPDWSI